ncbi:hypothetical protein ScPMuIL_000215 [Solemya velum]
MGAVNSCCIPRKSGNDCSKSNSNGSRIRGHKRNLSATFSMTIMDDDGTPNLLNINNATEEELMTLPGIPRCTAKNIIEYRKHIGGFKRVEDLALVTGVGATKLNHIRAEICCFAVKRLDSSRGVTPSGSKSDLEALDRVSRNSSLGSSGKINLNTSNVFQLMKVRGITQTLAENIVTYRNKKGLFQNLDELVKVKGMEPLILTAVRNQLTLETVENVSSKPRFYLNGELPTDNGISRTTHSAIHANYSSSDSKISPYIKDFLEVFIEYIENSARPEVTPFDFKHKRRKVVRVASWNVERLSVDKAKNPGVRDVICMTILENGLGLIAFQELADKEALDEICNELNSPSLPNVKKWAGSRGRWKCCISGAAGKMYQSLEYNGFLYDTSQRIELLGSTLLKKPSHGPKQFSRLPFIGSFKIWRFDCVVVSVHLKATGLDNKDLGRLQEEIDKIPSLVSALKQHCPGEKDIILLGDFNRAPDVKDFDDLRADGFENVIPSDKFTNISTSNPTGSHCYDNIWLSQDTTKVKTVRSGVIRQGLTSPWIPDGWKWGGVVSDHCPVWAELCTGKDLDDSQLETGMENVRLSVK